MMIPHKPASNPPNFTHQWYFMVPQTQWPHLGFLQYGLRRGINARWSHPCPANLVTLTAQKLLQFPFLTEDSAKAPSPSVSDGSLARNLGLGSVTGKFGDPYSTKVPSSSVFEGSLTRMVSMETSLRKVSSFLARWARFLSYVHSVFRDVLRSKTSFEWQVQDTVHVFIRVAGVALFAWAFTGVAQNESCLWESFCGRLFFGEFGQCWERVESFVFVVILGLDMIMIPCGRCGTSDASGSLFAACAILLDL